MTGENMLEMAKQAVRLGQKKGAQEVAVNTRRTREVSVSWRDGNLEKLHEATTAALSLQLYVDGRYSAVSTSDLRPEALEKFIENAISLARSLAPDPYRSLPDPQTYKGQADIDLQLEDASYDSLSAVQRRKIAQSMEEAARAVDGAQAILSVTTQVADSQSQHFKVHSNGFEGTTRETSFWLAAEASVQDPDGRRPEDYDFAGSRFFKQLPDSSTIGRQAAQRALQRIGAQKGSSAVVPVAIDYRAGGRIFSYLIGPLSAASLQQKRSMFEGKLETTIGSPLLSVHDDPLIPKAFGSYLFDGEGMAAKRLAIFESGVLKNYYVDCYYGKKLKMTPTTGNSSNLIWKLGSQGPSELYSQMKEGILITGFLGGNSNSTTGDFSLGIQGFRIRQGKIAEPVAEMNLSGNHLDFWKRLVAVGNDPHPYSSLRIPTLVFDKVQIAGM